MYFKNVTGTFFYKYINNKIESGKQNVPNKRNPIFWKWYLNSFSQTFCTLAVSESSHIFWVPEAVAHLKTPRFEYRVCTQHFTYSLWPEAVDLEIKWLR